MIHNLTAANRHNEAVPDPTGPDLSGPDPTGPAPTGPDPDASLQEAAEVAGDRWVLLTLGALRGGPRRFGDLVADLPKIAPNILIDRLRRMERYGLLTSTPYSHRPRRFVYDLSESGRELAAVLPALTNWAARRNGSSTQRHAECGTPLEVRTWCPACLTIVDSDTGDDPHAEDLRWL